MPPEQIPKRHIGQPDDITAIAVFLASRARSYITAAVLPTDGR
jgi:NAD(P)-dependent dehydrogenase (short-subunit alcohol dehydrogenase family)